VSSLDGEFVASDGRVVMPPNGIEGAPSAGPATVALSAARPNPFSNETRFELTLSAAAPDVKLAIYDLTGRLVASLHSGALGAGSHAFVWDGRRADGTRAADGVYFYRARTGSSVMSKRIVSMRGR
jgi:flagellar hook assembly protein FlgD